MIYTIDSPYNYFYNALLILARRLFNKKSDFSPHKASLYAKKCKPRCERKLRKKERNGKWIYEHRERFSQYAEKNKTKKAMASKFSFYALFCDIRMTIITLMTVGSLVDWRSIQLKSLWTKATKIYAMVESIKDKSLDKTTSLFKVFNHVTVSVVWFRSVYGLFIVIFPWGFVVKCVGATGARTCHMGGLS